MIHPESNDSLQDVQTWLQGVNIPKKELKLLTILRKGKPIRPEKMKRLIKLGYIVTSQTDTGYDFSLKTKIYFGLQDDKKKSRTNPHHQFGESSITDNQPAEAAGIGTAVIG